MICDLHIHSVFSDGTYTPQQIICKAERKNIAAAALCDHDTLKGLPDFLKAAEKSSVIAVPGVEISTDYSTGELHILGLFIKEQHYESLTELMEKAHRWKEESNEELIENLKKGGYAIDYDEIRASNPEGRVNRAHIAAYLTKKGYTETITQAFNEILAPEFGFYIPPKRLDAFEAIQALHDISALPILAHPFRDMTEEQICAFIPQAKECGLAGMECRYSLYSRQEQDIAESIAEKFGLLKSGGSDFHGENKPDIELGSGMGNLEVPFEYYEKLKEKNLMRI